MRFLPIVMLFSIAACGSKDEHHALAQMRWATEASTGNEAGPIP